MRAFDSPHGQDSPPVRAIGEGLNKFAEAARRNPEVTSENFLSKINELIGVFDKSLAMRDQRVNAVPAAVQRLEKRAEQVRGNDVAMLATGFRPGGALLSQAQGNSELSRLSQPAPLESGITTVPLSNATAAAPVEVLPSEATRNSAAAQSDSAGMITNMTA